MKTPFFVALAGADNAGKSSIAKVLCEQLVSRFKPHTQGGIFSFGTGVREELLACDASFSREEVFAKPTSPKVRVALRTLGEYRRASDSTYWVKKLAGEILPLLSNPSATVIIDDLRFVSEANFVIDNGGVIIYLRSEFDPTLPTFEELQQVAKLSSLYIKSKEESPAKLASRILELRQELGYL